MPELPARNSPACVPATGGACVGLPGERLDDQGLPALRAAHVEHRARRTRVARGDRREPLAATGRRLDYGPTMPSGLGAENSIWKSSLLAPWGISLADCGR